MTNEQTKAMALRIKERRTLLNYTQEQFSEVIGLSMSSYSKIENNFQTPSLDTLISIADKLSVSIDYLVYGNEKLNIPTKQKQLESVIEYLDPEKLKHTKDVITMLLKLKQGS